MATPMVMGLPEEDVALYKAAHPIKQLVSVKAVADNVVWLCSEAGNYTTGSIVSVDGGYIAH
jgi:enoyl-[acyl-carrier-protein] reductase (NADH)